MSPEILFEAKELFVQAQRSPHGAATEDLERVRGQLRAVATHPACSDELRERVEGALLVFEVLAAAQSQREATIS